MEVAVLTARLEAQVAGFEANMRSARLAMNALQRDMKSMEMTARDLREQLTGVKLGVGQAAETKAVADSEVRSLHQIRDAAIEAAAAIEMVTGVRAFGGGYMTRNRSGFTGVYRTGNQLGGAPRAIGPAPYEPDWMRVQRQLGAAPRQLGPSGWHVPGNDFRIVRNVDYENMLRMVNRQLGPGMRALPSAEPDWTGMRDSFRRVEGRLFDDVTRSNVERAQAYIDKQAASRAVSDVEGILSGGRTRSGGFFRGGGGGGGGGSSLLSDLYSGGGRYGGRGGRYNVPGPNILAGILPGGARARPAALAALGIGIGALGPAAVPAAAGLGVGVATALPALIGAMGTLKLAFADMSAAAFTTKAAFDKLTPAQQSFVITLKSLDAGVLKPLEKLAQEQLLPKLTTALHTALSPQLVGAARTTIGAFSGALGGGANDIAKLVGSPEFAKNFGAVMVADARYVRAFIDDIGRLADSFFVVLKAAVPFTNWLSGLGTKLTVWIDATSKATAANGSLAAFFDKAKIGLTAIGKLGESLTKFLGAFGNAIGFKNSVAVFQLLTDLIQGLANFLNANRNVFNDFLKGAIQSAHDLMTLLNPLIGHLQTLLQTMNSITKAIGGWRVVIDAAVGLWLVKMGMAISNAKIFNQTLGETAAAETLMGASMVKATTGMALATTAETTNVARLGLAVKGLQASILGFAGRIIPWVIALSIVPQNDSTGSILATLGIAVAGGFRAGGPIGAAVGGAAALTYEAGRVFSQEAGLLQAQNPTPAQRKTFDQGIMQLANKLPPSLRKQFVGAVLRAEYLHTGGGGEPLKQAAQAAQAWLQAHQAQITAATASGAGAGGGGGDNTYPLPAAIQAQVSAAAFGGGSMTKANAAAYAYYKNLLKNPNLTRAQRIAIENAGAQYAPPAPSQLTGGGGGGFSGPTTYGGAVFNAQQAVQQAMGTGSGVSFSQQVALAKAYEHSAAAALEHLKKQKVAVADRAAKAAELKTLAHDEAQAQKYIAAILDHQTKAIAKMVDDSRKLQISQHQTRISAIRSGLTGGFSGAATPEAALAVVNHALRAAGNQLLQLTTFRDKLLGQDKQTVKLKTEENQIQKEINATLGIIKTAQKDQAKALKAQISARTEAQMERILGLNPHDPKGAAAAARTTGHLRDFLNSTLKHFGLGQTGSSPLGPFVKELYKLGDINKNQYRSLEKILQVISLMKKDTGTVSSSITGNVAERLKEIKQELQSTQGFSNLNPVTTEQQILKNAGIHISGTAAQRAKFMEQANEALGLRGHLHHGSGSALGVPLTADGLPAMLHPGIARHLRSMGRGSGPHARQLLSASYNADPWSKSRMYDINLNKWVPNVNPKYNPAAAGPVQGETHVSININGFNKDEKKLAEEIYKIFQKQRRRNTTLMTGANAGRNLGNGLG